MRGRSALRDSSSQYFGWWSAAAIRGKRHLGGTGPHEIGQECRLTQKKLALEVEIDLTYVGGIEQGKRNPSLLVIARIADALAVPLTKCIRPAQTAAWRGIRLDKPSVRLELGA